MDTVIIHNDPKQAALDRAILDISSQLGISPADVRQNISMETLRLIKAIPASGGMIEFNPVEGNDSALDSENKLSNTEVAVVYEVGLAIHSFTGTSITAAAANIGEAFPYTFPDPDVFTFTKTGESSEAVQLMRVYQGTLEFENGRKTHAKIHTSRLLFVPTAVDADLAEYGPSEGQRGMATVYPQFYIDGGEKNRIKLNICPGVGTNMDASTSSGSTASTARRNAVSVFLNVFRYTKPNATDKCSNTKV